MLRRIATTIAVFASLLGASSAHAQITQLFDITSVSPSTLPAQSAATAFTMLVQGSSRDAAGNYGVCFYPGSLTDNSAIASLSATYSTYANPDTLTYYFTVPVNSLRLPGTASIYFVPNGDECNGINRGYSNTFSFSVTSDYGIKSVSPSSILNGSSDTTFTLSGAASNTAAYTDDICFYNGTSSVAITPSSFNGSGATFTVPASSLSVSSFTEAQVYLVPPPFKRGGPNSTCTGANPGLSNAVSVPIRVYTINSASPSPIPAGSGDTVLTIQGAAVGTDQLNYDLCFYNGANSALIAPNGSISSTATFTIPASSLHVSGQSTINAQIYLNQTDAPCNGINPFISNSLTVPISIPTLGSLQPSVLPQANPASALPYPRTIEAFGTNFAPNASLLFRASGTDTFYSGGAGKYVSSTAIFGIPPYSILRTASSVDAIVCPGDGVSSCSGIVTTPTYALATTTSTLTSSNPAPAINQTINLTTAITPAAGSQTAGGNYIPGVPSGTVTFKDGQTNLGTAPLTGKTLTFAPVGARSVDIGEYAGSLNPIIADFNRDGVPDVLLVQSANGLMHLFFGTSPTGNFLAESTINSAQSCYSLAGVTAGDFNGDGYPDIAYLCGSSGGYSDLYILYNNGDGTFADPQPYYFTDAYQNQIYLGDQIGAADVNKDGKLDLVVTGPNTPSYYEVQGFGIQVLLGDGAGNFTVGPAISTPDDPGTQLTVKDLNNDGAPDLALLHYDTANQVTNFTTWQNDGTGNFTLGPVTQICACTTTTSKLFVAPLTTASLYPDITVAFTGSNPSTIVALNKKTSTIAFDAPKIQSIPSLTDALLADFNNDGFADLVFYNGTSEAPGSVTTLNGDGTGAFAAQSSSPTYTATISGFNLLAATDLNQDGFPDLLTYNYCVGNCTFLSHNLTSFITSGASTATLPASFSASGAHTITTAYNGTVDVLGSSGTTTVNVPFPAVAPVFQISGPPSFNVPGTSATQPYSTKGTYRFFFQVKKAATDDRATPSPTGSVSTYEGSNLIGAVTLSADNNGNTTATASIGSVSGGTHIFTITYSGDTNFQPVSVTYTYVITPLATTITWIPNPATIPYGTALSTAQLDAVAKDPSGNNISSLGSFRYTPGVGSVLNPGTYTLQTVFTPNTPADYTGSSQSATVTVSKANISTFALSASPIPQTYNSGAPTVVSITLNGPSVSPTGTVQFFDGSTSIGTGTLTSTNAGSSVASLTLSSITAGSHAFGANYLGDTVYSAFVVPLSRYIVYNVGKVTPTLTWTPAPQTIPYGTTLSSAQLDATAKDASGTIIPGSFVYQPAAGTLLDAGEHSLSLTFNPTDTTNYSSATDNASVIVTKFTPVISWTAPASIPYGTALSATQLDAVAKDLHGATVPGTFSYAPPAGTVLNVGTTQDTATFTPTSTLDFNTATATVPIVVTSGSTNTVLQITPATTTYGQPIALVATVTDANGAPVSGTVTFADHTQGTSLGQFPLVNGVATATANLIPVGAHNIGASYDGNSTYLASTSTSKLLTITRATPTLTWTPTVSSVPFGTPLSASQLDAAVSGPASIPSVPGVFTYTPAAGTVLAAGTQRLSVTFVPADATNFSSITGSTVITVTKAVPTLTWPAIAAIAQGTALSGTQLDATATGISGISLPGVFTYTPVAGTVLPAGTQPLSVSFAPTDSTDYSIATATNSIVVQAGTVVVVTSSQNPAYSGVPVSYSAVINHAGSTPATGTVTFFDGSVQFASAPVISGTVTASFSSLSVGTHSIHAVYTGDANYTGATSANYSQVIYARQASVIWNPTPSTIPYGTPLGAGQLNATAFDPFGNPLSGTFTYTPAPGTVLQAGTETLSVLFTPLGQFAPVTKTAVITVTKISPTITWPAPAPINQGTPLSATQLDATATGLNNASLPGVFTYTPAAGTILQPGSQTLTLSFVPTDTVDYLTTPASIILQVNHALTTTTLASTPNPSTFGQPVTLTATVVETGTETAPLTGTVTFRDTTANTQLAVIPLTAGKALFTTSTLTSGSHALTATYSGDTNYTGSTTLAATTQVVGTMTPIITWAPTVSTISYGTPLSTAQLNAVAKTISGTTIPGAFTYTPALGSILTAGSQTLSLSFAPTDTTNFQTTTAQTVITVTRAIPTITWPALAAINQGAALSGTQLDATAKGVTGASLPGIFKYTPAIGTVLQPGLQTLSLSFTPTDATDYSIAIATNTLQVNDSLTRTVLISSQNPTTFGQPTTITATVSQLGSENAVLTGNVIFTDATKGIQIGKVAVLAGQATLPISTLTVGSHVIEAEYSGDSNYLGSSATPITQVVNTAAPVLTFTPTVATISYGTALGAAQLDAVAKTAAGVTIPGAFTYTPAAGTILSAGSQTLKVVFTPTDTTNFQTATAQTVITVTKGMPSIAWPTPAPIVQGTALSATQLNAAATYASVSVPGTYTYTPPAGTIPDAGVQTLTLLFTPTDKVDFNPVTTTNSISVSKSATTTAVTSSVNPTSFGQSTNLTATVVRNSSSTSPLTGSILFLDGTTPIGKMLVTSGAATLPVTTLTVGSHTITATYSGDIDNLASSGQLTQLVTSIGTNITWSPVPATIVYGTALTSGQFDAVARNAAGTVVPGSFTYTPAVGTIPQAGTQTLTASFTPTDPVHDASAQATTVINVTRATPTITWPTPATIDQGTALSGTQLNASAKGVTGAPLSGTFTYTPAAGTILLAGAHTLSVTFVPADTVDYTNATATVSLTVLNAMTQTVLTSTVNPSQFGQPTILTASITRLGSITSPLSGTVTFYDGTTALGNPVPVALPNVPGGPNFATLPIATLAAGTHKLTAVYSGDTNYTTSTSTQLTQTITVASTTLTWTPTVATIPYGAALSAAQLDAVASSPYVASVPGLITYTPATGTVLNAGTQTLKAAFTPNDAADFTASAGSATITITQATPKITWTTPAAIAQGTPLSATQLNANVTGINGATLPGAFTYTPAAGTILQAGTTTLTVLFTPTDTINYTTVSAAVPLTVNIPTTRLVLTATPNPAQTGQPVTLTATVSETGTSTQPIAGTVTFYDAGKMIGSSPIASNAAVLPIATLTVGTHSFSAVYSGSANYATSTSNTLPELVTAATTTIHWTPAPASIVYGTALSAAQLDATASSATTTSVPGHFTYTPATGVVLTAGTQTLSVTFTPTDTVNFASSTATTTITVTRATPTVTWTAPAPITQGTALSATQLNAAAKGVTNSTLPGAFTYTPAAGAILPSGNATLSVFFTPTDIVDYTTSTATVPLTVNIPAAATTLASSINPSQYGQSTNLVATVVPGGTLTAIPTGSVNFFDGAKLLGASPLNQAGLATLPITALTAGPHALTAAYSGDTANATSTSALITQTVTKAPSVITFAPNPASIVYGTPLSAAQLNATVTSLYIPTVTGAFTYTPATGTVLGAGTTTLSTTFTPTDTGNFTAATQTASLTVTKATPTLTFPTPPYTVVGSALSATQLNASATGVTGAPLPGTFTYSPAAGTIVAAGPQTLTVTFTPTDTTDYTTAKATTTLNATALSLTSLDSTKATLGDKAKTVTLTGTGFVSDSVARSNGAALATTYVNATTLQAILPATSFLTVQTLQISVFDPTQNQTTASIPFTVVAPPVNATVSAPPTAGPGDQPSITLNLATPYAFPVTAKFSLSFTPASGGIVDPNIQFAGGGQTTSFNVAAGQTTAPAVQIQSGTVAGVIRITLSLTAGGIDVTPAGTTATIITVPAVVPGLTQVAATATGRQLTVTTFGFSNTREISQAHFHFTPVAGQQIQTQDITLDVTSIFSGWFTSPASDAYGSEFLYTQTFTLDDDASIVGQVTVTLSNSIGVSAVGTSQ